MRSARWFTLFLVAHLVIWTVMPILMRGNLPFDTSEGIAWGNLWAFGYDKHPYLAAWLTAGITNLFLGATWPVYLLSQLAVITCFFAMWRLARHMLPEAQAMTSIMLLEGIYYYNVASTQFNPNILMLPIWALTAWMFYEACTRKQVIFWLLTGMFAGLAMSTKYESLLLLLMMLIFSIWNQEARAEYRKPGIYLGFLVAILVFLPNMIWVVQHHFLPFTYTEGRLDENQYAGIAVLNHVWHPLSFFLDQAGAVLPIFALFLPCFFAGRSHRSLTTFHRQFLGILGAGPFLLVIFTSILTGAWLNALWAFPLFSFAGIILCATYHPKITPKSHRIFLILIFSVMVLIAIFRGLFLVEGPYLTHRDTAALFPGKILSQEINAIWQANDHTPLYYVAGKRTFVSNVIAYAPYKSIPYYEWDLNQSPWMQNENALRCHGAMFVWDEGNGPAAPSSLPPEIAQRFPSAKLQMSLNLAHLSRAPLPHYNIGVAVLPPDIRYCQNR